MLSERALQDYQLLRAIDTIHALSIYQKTQ